MKSEQPRGEISALISSLRNEISITNNTLDCLYADLGYVLSDPIPDQPECGANIVAVSPLGQDLHKILEEVASVNIRIADIRSRLQL